LGRIGVGVGKTDAVAELARRAGLNGVDPHGWDLDATFDALNAALAPDANASLRVTDLGDHPGLGGRTCFPARQRPIAAPDFRNGRPESFPERFGSERSPAFRVLSIPDGVFLNLARAPVALLSDRRTILRDVSSRYAALAPIWRRRWMAPPRSPGSRWCWPTTSIPSITATGWWTHCRAWPFWGSGGT
jgi:hypothetical protein